MKTFEALTIAIAAVEASQRPMPDDDVKTALRVLWTTRRGELEKVESALKASLT